jgi:hypothetical protein
MKSIIYEPDSMKTNINYVSMLQVLPHILLKYYCSSTKNR